MMPVWSNLRWTVVQNIICQFAVQLTSLATGVASNMILSRYLGVEGFGVFNYIFAFYALFLSFNDFGTNTILIRELAKNRGNADRIMGTALLLKLLIAGVCMAAACVVISFMHSEPELKKSLYLYAVMLFVIVLQLPMVIFQVDLKMKYTAALGVFNRLFQFALVMLVVRAQGGLVWLIAALVAGDALFLPAYWIASRRFLKPVLRMDGKVAKAILKSSIPLGAAGILNLFANQINALFLERLSSLHEVGLYAAAFRITSPALLIPPMIMATIYPLMSRYAASDTARLRRLYIESMMWFCAAGAALGAGGSFFAPWIVRVIFGSEFEGAVPVLRILIWSVSAVYFGIASGNLLVSIGRERLNVYILGAGAVVNTFLVLQLVPRLGALGSAVATACAFAVIVAASVLAVEFYFAGAARASQQTGPSR